MKKTRFYILSVAASLAIILTFTAIFAFSDIDEAISSTDATQNTMVAEAGTGSSVSSYSYNASNTYYYVSRLGTLTASANTSKSNVAKSPSDVNISVSPSDSFTISLSGDLATARANGRLYGYLKYNWTYAASGGDVDESYMNYSISGGMSTSGQIYNSGGVGQEGTLSSSTSGTNSHYFSSLSSNSITVSFNGYGRASDGSGTYDHFSWGVYYRKDASISVSASITSCWLDIYFRETPVSSNVNNTSCGYVSNTDTSLRFYETDTLTAHAYAGYYFTNWSGNSSSSSKSVSTSCGFQYSGTPSYTANFAAINVTNNGATFTYNGSGQGPTASAGSRSVTNYYATSNAGANSTTTKPITVGTYYYRCIVNSDSDYGYTNWTAFTIQPKSLSGNVSFSAVGPYTYKASAYTPTPNVTDTARQVILSLNTDYTIAYSANTNAGTATITYTGKGNYTGTTTSTFVIQKCTPTLSSISATGITFGQSLANSTVSGTATNATGNFTLSGGTWSYRDSTTKPAVSNSNSTAYTVQYVPSDTANYNTSYSTRTLTVSKCTPTLSGIAASQITYGQFLSASTVNGTSINSYDSSTVSGSFKFTAGTTMPAVANSSSTAYGVTFTPTDTANYNTNTASTCKLVVIKATPTIINATSATIVYEHTLADAAVSATIKNPYNSSLTVNGSLYWYTDSQPTISFLTAITDDEFIAMPQVSESGNYPIIFIPSDSANYNNNGIAACPLTVTQKTQTITLTPLTADDGVANESIATKTSGYVVWADYETETGTTFTLTAYTTAIYPSDINGAETPRQITVTPNDANMLIVGAPSYSFETVNGVTYSKVTVSLTAQNEVGVAIIYINQYDNVTTSGSTGYSTVNLGNYYNAATVSCRLYIKNIQYTDTFSGAIFEKNYGDSTFDIKAALNSGFKNHTIASSDTDIVTISVSDMNDAYRTVTIHNAGSATLTLTHPGYVDTADSSVAYLALTETATITVSPVDLTIRIEDISIIYGTAPVINYSYDGWKYDDGLSIPVTVTANSYVFADMHDVKRAGNLPYGLIQSYTIIPTTAINNGYANYTFTFVESYLTINPKTVVATIEDDTKFYGSVTPDFPITYSGWSFDEDETTANVTSFPTINYGMSKSNPYQDIGTYTISFYANAVSLNYVFNTSDTAVLTIVTADVVMIYEPWDVDFDGVSHGKDADISGVPGGADPVNLGESAASFYQYSLHGENSWTSSRPIDAGSYDVKISFFAKSNDNYHNTVLLVENGLTVNAVNPIIELDSVTTGYLSVPIAAICALYGVHSSYDPEGEISYYYKASGADDSTYTLTTPINAGVYTVKVLYTANTPDNYKTYFEVFEDALTISKVSAILTLVNKVTVYNVSDSAPTRVSSNMVAVSGFGNDIMPTNGEDRFLYEYLIGDVYTTELPYNAGTYPVRITYFADADDNYNDTTVIFATGVVIEKASLLESVSLNYSEELYTGEVLFPCAAEYYGLEDYGGSAPTGTISYAFQIAGSLGGYVNAKGRTDANTYNVRVTYTSRDGDNYASCSVIFASNFVICRVAPTLTFKPLSNYTYSGAAYTVTAVAGGTPAGSEPAGTITYTYLVYGVWTSNVPVDVGTYSVKAFYQTISVDNYTNFVAIATDYLVIVKTTPTLSINLQTADYTGSPIIIEGELAGARGATYDAVGPLGTLSYLYKKSTATEWTANVPVESGKYDVLVSYTAKVDGVDERNYSSCNRTFINAITINNIAPVISLEKKTVFYNGDQVEAPTPTISEDSGDALGTITIEYRVNNEWTTIPPQNAGTYSIRVIYRAAVVDNYKSHSAKFDNYLKIESIPITVSPIEGQTKVYDGVKIDGSTIAFTADDLIYGNVWTGTLASDDSAAAGLHEITAGDLSAGSNYSLTFEEGVYYSIERKTVDLIFADVNPVYDGGYKYAKITVDPESLIGNDAVTLDTDYSGDYRNVGSFTAIASLSYTDKNYTLPEVSSKTYTITPAKMVGNTFESYETQYDGKVHQLLVGNKMEGATVSYDAPTQYMARGSYRVTATISKANYADDVITASLTIVKGKYSVKVYALVGTYYYGDTLPVLRTDRDAYGTATLNEGQELLPGTADYNWTFIPNDDENYDYTTGTLEITVSKAIAVIHLTGALTQTVNSPKDLQAYASSEDGSESYATTIYYVGTDGTVYSSRPTTSGRYEVVAVFSGNDYYEKTEYITTITIESVADLWWVWLIASLVLLIAVASVVFFTFRKKRTIK